MLGQTPPIQTVTEITRSIKVLLENGFSFVSISGEVSNLRRPFSGHQYFTLKDKQSQLKAVIFKTQQRYLAEDLADGKQIICHGRISVYETRGDYQIIVDSIDFAGTGLLQIAYERLKQKLDAEGLFSETHKRKLPFLPERIALITSPQGAALYDFMKIAQTRFAAIPLEIYPTVVQGDSASREIIKALALANDRQNCDVIVICRGGGSLEDLWPFNDEHLARAVWKSDIPVVSAVGHEIDFTILDFVADHRAPTPTAAAEAVMPDQNILHNQVHRQQKTIISLITRQVNEFRHRINMQSRLLGDPSNTVNNFRIKLDHIHSNLLHNTHALLTSKRHKVRENLTSLESNNPEYNLIDHKKSIKSLRQRLQNAISQQMEKKNAHKNRVSSLLRAINPMAVLERGYSIVQALPGKEVVHSSDQVSIASRVIVRLHKGELECEVKEKHLGTIHR